MKGRNIFGEGKYISLPSRRKSEKENEENIWRKNFLFFGGEGNGDGKRGNFLEKENVMMTDTHTVNFEDGARILDSEFAIIIIFPKQ